jgi:hypothetical protein
LRKADAAVAAAGLACFACVAGVVAAAHETGNAAASPITPPGGWRPLLYVALIGALATYALGCWLAARTAPSLLAVAAVAAGVQLVPLAGPLLLSTDATSYATYGRAAQPYHLQDGWATPSVYGPLWTFVSEPIARLGRPELGFRVLAAVCGLAIGAGAAWLAVNHAAALVLVGWNPLLALHDAGGGHNDALMITLVVLALVFERAGRIELAGAAWAASVWIKWASVVFWALWVVWRYRQRRPLGAAGFAAVNLALLAAAFARFGTDWLHLFKTGSEEARRESSIGLLAWLGHLGVPHREALALSALALLGVLAGLLVAHWRGVLRLGLAGDLVALAQARLNPWYGVWGIGLAGATEEVAGRVLAVGLTALLLVDVLPR